MATWLQLKSPFLISRFISGRDYAINSSLMSAVEYGWSLLTNPSASTFMKLRIHNLSCFHFSFGFLSSEPKLVLRYNNFHLCFLVIISPSSMWISSSFLYFNDPVHVFILSHFKSFVEVGRVQIINKMVSLVLLSQSHYWFIFGLSLLLPSQFPLCPFWFIHICMG